MTDAARALDALGDSTRRRVLELLHVRERTVRELTDALPVTQSAVSQHLRVLREAGLVDARAEGVRRVYRVDLDGLAPVRSYLDMFWDDVLGAFAAYANEHCAHPARSPAATGPPGARPRSGALRKATPPRSNRTARQGRPHVEESS